VKLRIRPFFLALTVSLVGLGVLIALGLGHVAWNSSPESLIRRLPADDAALVCVDLEAIRYAGLFEEIASVDVDVESDYREFVEATGFDYEQDLDFVLASFQEFETFLILEGRFDWGRLRDYVDTQGGTCYNGFCQLEGSGIDRQISFFSITPNALAMYVGADPWGAWLLARPRTDRLEAGMPDGPVWVSAPGSVLEKSEWIPEEAQSAASRIFRANRLVLSLSPGVPEFEARLRLDYGTAAVADDIASQMRTVAGALAALDTGGTPDVGSASIASLLAEGEFRSEGASVYGAWPVSRTLLQQVLTGAP